ncbi:MAG: tRNA (N6-isopentenyl adenosine(37)-C2)-methylthiotransferase MiaB [Succinivibrionaceae bacterium]
MSTFLIETWGCQMNEYDSNRIRDLMTSANYTETHNTKEADVIILVTCAIREKAQEKVFNQIFSWKAHGEYKENVIICVGGCVASQEGEEILKRTPMVGVVFGPQTIHRLINMIEQFKATNKSVIDISFPAIEKFEFLPNPKAYGNSSAFVTIMEGCSNFCTYCVVPYTRGQEVSRNVNDVLNEVKILCEQGVKEINLIGQNVNSYQGLYSDGTVCNFAELLYLVAAIEGVERIRFTTSNPHDFTDEIIQAFSDLPQISNAIHLPVQNGSNRILKLMNRKYTREQYIDVVTKLRAVRPDIYISTDFIVGFPGENEEDFSQTMDLIRTVNFDQSFSFVYSPRPNTPAATYEDNVDLQTKKNRLYKLQQLINFQAQKYSREMLGTEQKVLIDGISVKNSMELRGRTDNNRTVNFPGDPKLIGSFVKVKITDVLTHTLRGELIE